MIESRIPSGCANPLFSIMENPIMNKRAFTLIELLIVVAIIAILAAIAVPNFLEAQVRAKVSREINDMRAVATALESYASDCNAFPPHGEILANGTVLFPATQGGLTPTEYLPDWPL